MHPTRTAAPRLSIAPFTGRAQFSPLRRATPLNTGNEAARAARRSTAPADATRTIAVAPVAEHARVYDWWHPRLLDRLQAPLSRIRE